MQQSDAGIRDMYLTFVAQHHNPITGTNSTIELLPGGNSKEVLSLRDFRLFANALAYHYTLEPIQNYITAFKKGLTTLIPQRWISFFDASELQHLISGKRGAMDIDQLERYTKYSNGYHAGHWTIQLFWAVVRQFTPQQQAKLLKFVTSCSRPPLLGFQLLEPPFCIHQKTTPGLPSATTCVNQLKLPPYSDMEEMHSKLLYAIESESGFELS